VDVENEFAIDESLYVPKHLLRLADFQKTSQIGDERTIESAKKYAGTGGDGVPPRLVFCVGTGAAGKLGLRLLEDVDLKANSDCF
jgi:hypothetical protein